MCSPVVQPAVCIHRIARTMSAPHSHMTSHPRTFLTLSSQPREQCSQPAVSMSSESELAAMCDPRKRKPGSAYYRVRTGGGLCFQSLPSLCTALTSACEGIPIDRLASHFLYSTMAFLPTCILLPRDFLLNYMELRDIMLHVQPPCAFIYLFCQFFVAFQCCLFPSTTSCLCTCSSFTWALLLRIGFLCFTLITSASVSCQNTANHQKI